MKRTGQEILFDIDREARRARSNISELGKKISTVKSEIENLNHQKTNLYTQLAKLRLSALGTSDGKIFFSSHTNTAIKSLLAKRKNSLDDFDTLLLQNQDNQKEIEEKRIDLLAELEDFHAQVKEAEDRALQKVNDDDDYQSGLEKIECLETQISRVDNKLSFAKEDYEQKVIPYHNDPIFMYLWQCHYGTSEYQASGLIRMLDQWVSRVVRYEDAERNFSMLSGIPEKLESYRLLLEKDIESQELELDKIQDEYFKEDGVIGLQQEYKKRREELEGLDQALENYENEHEKTFKEKQVFLKGEDEYYLEAIHTLHQFYDSSSLKTLRQNAIITSTKQDNSLVRSLYELEDFIEDKEDEIHNYKEAIDRENKKLSEIQNVRKTFKKKKYDSNSVVFKDSNMFSVLLGQFVTGILTNAYFWSAVGHLCLEVLDELDIEMGTGGHSRHRKKHWPRSGSRSKPRYKKSRGGFKTGGRF